MPSKSEVKQVEMVVIPCPRCHSWDTTNLDKKKTLWSCLHMDCLYTFMLKNHSALLILKDGQWIRVDKDSDKRWRELVSEVLK